MRKRSAPPAVRLGLLLISILMLLLVPAVAMASPSSEMASVNDLTGQALTAAKQGDVSGAKSQYESYRKRWLEIEEGVRGQSKTAYRAIEDEMGNVQFALAQSPVDQAKLTTALTGLAAVNQRFINGEFPADGQKTAQGTGTVADLLALLDQTKERIAAKDATGASKAFEKFRQSWLGVEGIVLTESSKIYADAERDMLDVTAGLGAKEPDYGRALSIVTNMHDYLAPIAGKTSYSVFDAASIILREGLEALLIVVALLGFLRKAGHSDKGVWIWGGVGAGFALSVALAIAVKILVGTGAFGTNNFLLTGFTGIFAAVMLIWVSYWLHSKSSIAEWNKYIREKSTAALATGKMFSLATLAFLAIFREGTETALFYVGMAASITVKDMLLGLGLGFGILIALAIVILQVGLKVPMRPFFLVSSLLVFYLGFKFTGMGVHGLQLAGVLPATMVPHMPSIGSLAIYPNWEGMIPQLILLVGAASLVVLNQRRDRAVRQ